MRNEKDYINKCLESVINNDYPLEQLEIIVIDSQSDDGSREIVEKYAKKHPSIKLIDNPKITTPAGVNLGLRASKGDVIIWMSAHAQYEPDYIRESVRLLRNTDAGCVSGVLQTEGDGYIGKAIAVALSSRFAIGDAQYRYSTRQTWTDTAFGGAWHRKTLEELDGFDEDWIINADYELHYRLRQSGRKILLSPKIRSRYFCRSSIPQLLQQYFRYGSWKIKTLVAHPTSLRWRQLASPALVIGILLSLPMLAYSQWLGLALPIVYGITLMAMSLRSAASRGWRYLPLLPIVFAAVHLAWGSGFLYGLHRFGLPRLTLESLVLAFRRVG
jgi:glycosyltransferase involved in cell wall biosynthesis